MEKLVYVIWKREDLSEGAFKDALLGQTVSDFLELGVGGLSVNVADEQLAQAREVRLTRFDPPIAATVSLWLENVDDRPPCESVLGRISQRAAGYLVEESVALANSTHRAPLGQRTPGANVVACIERPRRMSREAWTRHWLEEHKKVALETQCTYQYLRNLVLRTLTEDAPPWEGIVEEGFPLEAVTDPMLWYRAEGSAEKMQANMMRMVKSVQAFLDIDRVESNPMSEYRIKE